MLKTFFHRWFQNTLNLVATFEKNFVSSKLSDFYALKENYRPRNLSLQWASLRSKMVSDQSLHRSETFKLGLIVPMYS